MKKFLAKEFLWLLLTILLAIPIAFLWLTSVDIVSEPQTLEEGEKIFVIELFLVAYTFGFLGIYLIRFIVAAIKAISLQKPEG